MGDILAIISKAQFEAAHREAKVGDALGFEKYVSAHAALEPVRAGGSIFLVTVRPPDERLWLHAELVNPKHDGKAWTSKASTLVVKDITAAIPQLEFANGKGLAPKKGAMGMSLQTPRLLTGKDSALLRGKVAQKQQKEKPEKAAQKEKAATVLPERRRGPSVPVANSRNDKAPSAPLGESGGGALASPNSVTLGAVLGEWRATRAPELELLIDTLSKHHARALPPLDPDAKDFDDQWNARAAAATPETLPQLLPGLWSDPRGSIPMRLRKLLDLGADPRLGAALLTMIDEPPLTASSNFSAWTMLFRALPSMVDTRASKRLKARAAKKGGDSKFWPKLTGWIEGALEDLAEPATLSKEQLASVAKRQREAEALLKGPPPVGAAKQEKAIVALPMSGSPRESLERAFAEFSGGKPLGALEPLRLFWEVTREPAAAELMSRIGKLAAATQPRFDGAGGKASELHPAWMKAGKRFDPTLVTPLLDALTAGKLVDTEERLELMLSWPADPRVAEAMLGLIDPGHTRGTYIGARPQLWKRTSDLLVRNADPRFIEVLQKNATRLESAEFPWAIRSIHLHDYALDAKVKPRAFPKLGELWLAMWASPVPTFWDAPLLQVVERLKMGGQNLYGEFPVDELIVAAPRLAKLKAVEVRTSALSLDVVKSGDGRADATFTLTQFPSVNDDWFKKMVERLRRIPSAAVRRFTVVEATKPRAGVLEVVNEATRHLARA